MVNKYPILGEKGKGKSVASPGGLKKGTQDSKSPNLKRGVSENSAVRRGWIFQYGGGEKRKGGGKKSA